VNGLEEIGKDKHILAFENQLNLLSQRLTEIERRLSILEKSAGIRRASGNPLKFIQSPQTGKKPVNHTYLKRAISAAKREYERERR
jgi:hypothetical protein